MPHLSRFILCVHISILSGMEACHPDRSSSPPTVELTVAATPSGQTVQPLLGVNAGPLPTAGNPDGADVTAQYQGIGVTMVRTHDFQGLFEMSVMYPDQNADPHDPASYDFMPSDRAIKAILDGGFEPYLRLGDSYHVKGLKQRAPTHMDNWIQAAVEVVRRYRQMAADAGIPLRYVEIWNEPDNSHFWDGEPIAFFELFARTAEALKAEFPDVEVGGPGLTPAGALTPKGQQYTKEFLAYLQEHSVPLDFFSWHMYSNDPQDYQQAARFYRAQLDAYGYTKTESHVSEWNVRKDMQPAAPTAVAALLSAFWIVLQDEEVAASLVYRGADPSLAEGAPWIWGLLYADGRLKPQALAFSLWARMATHPQRLNVGLQGKDDLWVLAGRDEQGEVAVLLVNTTEKAISWQAVFSGGDPAPDGTLYQVGGSGEQLDVRTLDHPAAEIGPYTVQLLLVHPV